jgi:hypothetical protein
MTLTHRGNVLDDANELGENCLSGDVALVDGVAAADGLESVIWPFLAGLPLELGQDRVRASCEGNVLSCRFNDLLIKGIEIASSKIGPALWAVEGLMDCANEDDRPQLGIPTRFYIVMSSLFEV